MGVRRVASAALALLGTANGLGRRSNSIEWQDCDPAEFNNTVSLECGTLLVPLDYASPNSSEQLQLQLIKTPAITQPSKGSILFNFGGPGEPGRSYFNSLVTELLPHTGGEFDLVAFDVRGTENTLALECFANEAEATRMVISWGQTSNSSDVAAASLFARAKIDANLCYQNAQVNGSLVSTAFTARDLISVVDALDEDGLLRYWGFSYGTTLGATVAAMFPDRIDKMILDGVQNPHEYYNALADFQEWIDTDATFSQIFSTCVAAGANCSLNALGMTADELEQATWDLLDYLKYNPLPFGDLIMDYSLAKSTIYLALYNPLRWPSFADTLTLLLSSNATTLAAYSDSMAGTTLDTPASIETSLSTFTAVSAIHCSDRKPRVSTFDEFRPVLEELYSISSVYGDGTDGINMHCAQWKIEPKERYEGGFEVATPNPVLFIGNTWDPYTPILSARNVSSGFNGSVVLEVKGYGHTSLAAPSKCTVKTVASYWSSLTMPEDGTVCELDVTPYSNTTWADLFVELGWSYTTGFATSNTTARRF